jgi:carbonic anhydrase
VETVGNRTRLRLNEHLSFLAKANLTMRLQAYPPGSVIILDGSAVQRIDHDVAEVLREFVDSSVERRIEVEVIGLEQLFKGGGGLAH